MRMEKVNGYSNPERCAIYFLLLKILLTLTTSSISNVLPTFHSGFSLCYDLLLEGSGCK